MEQSSLGQPILHGCELFNHLWDSLSCMAVSFSIISGTASPAWLWAFQSSLGTASPAWLWAFQSSLGQPLLHGCELFNHLWDSLSCMAVSFSIISGTASPAWLWALQSFLGQPILHGLGQRGLHLQSPFILLFSYLSNQYDGSTTHRDHTQKQVKPSSRPARLSSIAHQVKGVVHPPLDVAPSIAHQVGGGVHPHLMSQVGREPVTGKLLKTNFGALSINRQRVGYQKKAVQKCSRNKKVKLVRRSTQLVHLYPFVRFCQESWASLSNAAGLPATANPPDQPKVPEVKQPSQATQPTACPAPAAGPSPSSRHTRFWPWSSSSPTKHPPRHPPSAGYTTRGGGANFACCGVTAGTDRPLWANLLRKWEQAAWIANSIIDNSTRCSTFLEVDGSHTKSGTSKKTRENAGFIVKHLHLGLGLHWLFGFVAE